VSRTSFPDNRDGILEYLRRTKNWDRWGPDDQKGAANLISPENVTSAAALVQSGVVVSLSRLFPSMPSPANVKPAQHHVFSQLQRGTGGAAMDYVGIACHGINTTHLDALCHVWDEDGVWGGKDPDEVVQFHGVTWGDVDKWSSDLVTRGVLADIPQFRGCDFVELEHPVTGDELEATLAAQGVEIGPGDALVVYSGRDAWSRQFREYGTSEALGPGAMPSTTDPRPGLHASCLEFIHDHDVAILVWDMMDLTPNGFDLAWSVHAAIWAYGVGLVDNALLEPLALTLRELSRSDFMLTVAPLRIAGGTGSPVNPLAIL
jgi:kynurenine formamidase